MSSDFNYNFCSVVEEIFEIGNTTKSRCFGVRVGAQAYGKLKNLGSIKGRQETVDALIGNKHYPTIARLGAYGRHVLKPGTPEHRNTPEHSGTPRNTPEHRNSRKTRNTDFDGVVLLSHYRPCKK